RDPTPLVARACADLENMVLRLDLELLGHISDNVGLADGLSAGDRQRLIRISAIDELRGDEMLARHLVHGPKHCLIADAASAKRKLKLHAVHVGRSDIRHGSAAPLTGGCVLALQPAACIEARSKE